MWITRDLEPRLLRSARTRPVVVLTGARQTGKTSTFRRLFSQHEFVSLDLPTEAEQAEKEPESFFREHPAPVIIDEVQYAPGLFRYLKVAVDAGRNRHGQFLLTGSQKFTLMKSVSESLAGRADIVELETLSLAEIQAALPKMTPEAAIVRGGFPELHADPDIDHIAFYNSYLATYLERDVRSLANVGSLRDFERFLRACALRSANLLNKARGQRNNLRNLKYKFRILNNALYRSKACRCGRRSSQELSSRGCYGTEACWQDDALTTPIPACTVCPLGRPGYSGTNP
jgi:uncharacterized protein